MSGDVNLFGEPLAKPQRYGDGTRPPGVARWRPAEDLVLIPLICACHAERQYFDLCRAVCSLFCHLATPAGERPLTRDVADGAVGLIERRTVTSTLDACGPTPHHSAEVRSLAVGLYRPLRARRKVMWGEHRLAHAWAAKVAPHRPGIDVLSILLSRPPGDDRTVEEAAKLSLWPQESGGLSEIPQAEVLAFRDCPHPDTWAALHAALAELEG